MRMMSFMLTTQQFRDRTKTVTRRLNWKNLKPGTLLLGVEKAMGLKKGEAVKPLGVIVVRAVLRVMLGDIKPDDVVREGFPWMSTTEFIDMFCEHMGGDRYQFVTRIEFLFVPGSAVPAAVGGDLFAKVFSNGC